jgi:hypothetical protein
MLELSGVFMLVTLAVFVVYGVFSAAVRKQIIFRPRMLTWMRRGFGGAFLALAGRLAFSERCDMTSCRRSRTSGRSQAGTWCRWRNDRRAALLVLGTSCPSRAGLDSLGIRHC